MKKNGYMLYELIISFALAFAILLVIFNTTISLNKKMSELYLKNKMSTKQIIMNKKIGTDFTNKKISSMSNSTLTDGRRCTITFSDNKKIVVEVSNKKGDKYVSIQGVNSTGFEKILLDDDVTIDFDHYACVKDTFIRSYTSTIKIPITYLDEKIDYGIELYNFVSR